MKFDLIFVNFTNFSEPVNDPTVKNSLIYSSTSSLSSVTTSSPVCLANVSQEKFPKFRLFSHDQASFQSTNLSSNIIGASSLPGSPPRITMLTGNPMVPLSLTSKPLDDNASKVSINPIKLPLKAGLMQIATSSSNGGHNQMPAALNLKAGEIPSSCQTMPLNLHAAVSSAASIQPLNGLKNGLKGYNR